MEERHRRDPPLEGCPRTVSTRAHTSNTAVARLGIATTVAVVSLTLLTGCDGASSESAQQQGFVDAAGYAALYDEAVKEFSEEMPPGAAFPAEAPAVEEGAQIERSVATAAVHFYWRCSWQRVYLETEDLPQREAAMRQLERFAGTPWAQSNYDDSSGAWSGALESASLGDASMLRDFYISDCESRTGPLT